ncbi:unnamed protein product, partial [Rotaria sp. Silwood2]
YGGSPGCGNPGCGNPGCGNPGCGNPGCGNPGCGNPGCGNPGCGDPGCGNPGGGGRGGGGAGGGAGGGGGSGVGGTCCTCSCTPQFGFGGVGGSGGAGGAGGAGGYGGGGAFGIYASGGNGTITDCSINPGTAGGGGAGATGRPGAGGSAGQGGKNSGGGCNNTTGGAGGSGGTGGIGGTGQQGAAGIRQTIVAINGAAISGSASTVPADGTVTVNWDRGCRLSQIDLTKSTTNDWGTFINTDPIFVKNLTSATTSFAANQNTVSIYYPASSALGDKSISTSSVTLANFIKLYGDRLISPVPTGSLPIIAPIAPPCPATNLSVSLDASFNSTMQGNITAWDWTYAQVSPTNNSGSPTTINASANPVGTPAIVTPPSGGWVAGATYQVKLRMKENCCGWSIPVYTTFTIPSAPATPTINTPATPGTVCANTSKTYTINTVAGATSYNWTVSGGVFDANGLTTISGSALSQIVDWGGTGSGTVTAQAVNSCGQTSGTVTWTVTKLSTPIVNLSGVPVSICTGNSVTISSGVASGTSPYGYAWSGGPISGSATGTSINTTTLTSSQTYTLLVTDVNGCTGTQNGTVTVTQTPTATISYSGTPFCKSVATAQSVTLSGTGAYTGGSYGASPAGLIINSSTGAITPSISTA